MSNVVAFNHKVAAIRGTDMLDRTTAPTRYEIELLCYEAELMADAGLPGINSQKSHFICDGHYYRTFWCDPGLIIGKRHKVPHVMKVTGECIIWCEDGVIYHPSGKTEVYSFSGDTQKVIWAFEAFECTTRHKTDCTDLEAIEAAVTEEPYLQPSHELKMLIAQGVR